MQQMNEAVATLFERWAYYYLHGKASKHDQRSLWHALRDPLVRVKIATLPPNYNLTFRPTSYLFSGDVLCSEHDELMICRKGFYSTC